MEYLLYCNEADFNMLVYVQIGLQPNACYSLLAKIGEPFNWSTLLSQSLFSDKRGYDGCFYFGRLEYNYGMGLCLILP